MTTYYSTHKDVSDFLRIDPFETFGSAPLVEDIESLINEHESWIEEITGKAWRAVTVIDERYVMPNDYKLFLNYINISALTKLEVFEHVTSKTWKDFVADYTKGEGDDYWYNEDTGIVYFINQRPIPGSLIKVTLTHGASIVPNFIKRATKLLVCADLVMTDEWSPTVPSIEDGGIVDYTTKADKWRAEARRIIKEKTTAIRTFNNPHIPTFTPGGHRW